MVIDKLSEINKYAGLHPRFAKAIDFIVTTNLMSLEPGTILVDGEDIKAIVINDPNVTEEASLAGFECHNTYIDIQIVLQGKEKVGWRSRTSSSEPKSDYDDEKDVLFYAEIFLIQVLVQVEKHGMYILRNEKLLLQQRHDA